jgi:8-oxo-dGTP pyrophosphatase MutT (NUDIX family)
MKRELLEEAGLNIDEYGETPELFGYYLIENDINASWSGEPYLQLRYLLKVNASSSVINLSVNEREGDLDNMEEAKFVDLDKLIDYIDWIKDREEYRVVLDLCSQSN